MSKELDLVPIVARQELQLSAYRHWLLQLFSYFGARDPAAYADVVRGHIVEVKNTPPPLDTECSDEDREEAMAQLIEAIEAFGEQIATDLDGLAEEMKRQGR